MKSVSGLDEDALLLTYKLPKKVSTSIAHRGQLGLFYSPRPSLRASCALGGSFLISSSLMLNLS